MLSEAITSSLRQIDDLELIEDPSRRKVYESDGLTAIAQIPPLVGLPNSLQALQETLRVCHTHGVPMVARGAGTGLSGGATPLADGLLIGLAKFNRILEIDPVKMTARVEPGVTNLAISKAVGQCGFVLCAGPVLPDRVHHWRQCRRKFRRRALPKVWVNPTQRVRLKNYAGRWGSAEPGWYRSLGRWP